MIADAGKPRLAAGVVQIPIRDGGLVLLHRALTVAIPQLMEEVCWQAHVLRLFGRDIPAPRLSAWYGDAGCTYRYSGLSLDPRPWTPLLGEMREHIETLSGYRFNSVLLNLYRDGRDSMSWHCDDESELGPTPTIASLSLGATRRFLLRRKDDPATRITLDLADGSLLLMEAPTQHYWMHSVPKTRRAVGVRINLTWRYIVAPSA